MAMRTTILEFPDTMTEAQALSVVQQFILIHRGEDAIVLGHSVKSQLLPSRKKRIWIGAKK